MEPRIALEMDQIQAFCEKWRVKEFYLFGSVLCEDFGPDSDVDVLIKKMEYSGIGLYEWMEMIEELEEIFGRKIDLVSVQGVKNPFIRYDIARTRRLIYAA